MNDDGDIIVFVWELLEADISASMIKGIGMKNIYFCYAKLV